MHTRHGSSSSFGMKILRSIPIAGDYFGREESESKGEAASNAACSAVRIIGQVASMYLFPWPVTAYFPTISSDMKTQMYVEIFTEMVARMGIGDAAAALTYRSAEASAHCLAGDRDTKHAHKIVNEVPVFGHFHFFDAATWQQALAQGVKGNLYQFVMLSFGGTAMMFSPGGMELDPTSVATTTSLMILSMMLSHILLVCGEEAFKKSVSCLSQFSLMKPKEPIVPEKSEQEALLTYSKATV